MIMPFGKYRGVQIGKLHRDYLEWLVFEVDLRDQLRTAINRELDARRRSKVKIKEVVVQVPPDWIKETYQALARQYGKDNGDIMKGINILYEALLK